MRFFSRSSLSSLCAVRFFNFVGSDFLYNPTKEHLRLRNTISRFCRDKLAPQAQSSDESKRFNVSLFQELGKMGMLALTVPQADGGAGMDATAAVILHHELGRYDPGFAYGVLSHSVNFINTFYNCAEKELRRKYLPKVISGEVIAGLAISEPLAGTDVLSMRTTAVESGDHYIINGTKTWITNGAVGQLFIVYAQLSGVINAFLVESGMQGFRASEPMEKCGMRSSEQSQLVFENMKVPKSHFLGSNELGRGSVTGMMRNMEFERLMLAAIGLGIAEECIQMMLNYAKVRSCFGKSIINFGQIQKHIAESYAETEAAKCLTYAVSRSIGWSIQNRIGSDAAKLFAAPVAKRVADCAIQVLGATGYSKEFPIERLWRDAKLLEITGGTLEAHQKNITKDLAICA